MINSLIKIQNFICILLLLLLTSEYAFASPIAIPEVNLNPKKEIVKKENEQLQTSHIDRKIIETSPRTNISSLLAQEQSIVRLTNNSGDSNQVALSIRGFGDNAVANSLILVDGFPLINPSLLAPNFNSIALSDIQRIDIYQGSMGTLWGDQAVGGVVNIVTRNPEKFIANANIGLGSFSKGYYSLFGGNKFKNEIFLKGFGFLSKNNNYRQHNQQNDQNIALQFGDNYARGLTSIYLQQYSNTINIPGGLSQAQYDDNPRQASNFSNFNHFTTQNFQLLNKHEITENWILENRLAYYYTKGDGFVNYAFNRNDSIAIFNPRLIGYIHNNKVTFGYDGRLSNYYLANIKIKNRATAQQNNVFVQDTFPIVNKLKFTLGARGAWQNNHIEEQIGFPNNSFNQVLVTEQGMTFEPTPAWQFYLRRDGNFRFPKANEEAWLPIGVTSLKLQTGVSYETGAEWTTEQQRIQLSLYRLQLHNEIAFDPTESPDNPIGTFTNFPETLRHGVTLTEYFKATSKLTLNGQLNYVNARFIAGEVSGKSIPAVPVLNGNLGFNYAFIQNWNVKYAALYTGSTFASQNIENVGSKLPGYWVNNIAIQYIRESMNISFEVANVLNQRYSTFTLFNPYRKTNSYYPGTGRSYLLTLNINTG